MLQQVVLILLIITSSALSDEIKSEFKRSLSKNCDAAYTLTCLKLDIVSWVEKLNEEDDYSVFPGVSLVRENSGSKLNTADIVADLAREFPNDPEARLDVFLMRKVSGFINNHAIKLNFWTDNTNLTESARKGGGGGLGGGKGGGGLGYLLAAGAMMKGALMSIALAGIAAVAGKALMAALISLLLSAMHGLKGHGGGGHGGHSYHEVIAKPHFDDYGGHSSYGRSLPEKPLPLSLQPDYKPGQ